MRIPFNNKQNMNTRRRAERNFSGRRHRLISSGLYLMAAVFIFNAVNAFGQTDIKTIEVVGTSTISKKDIEAAKEQAIANGLVSAVDKAVSDIVPVELLTQHFKTIDRTIYSEAEKYINDYKVLTEAVSPKHYRVLIQAKVSMDRLKSRLAAAGVMQVRKRNVQNIEIIVQGTRNLTHFINFRKGLKEMSGVQTIQVRDMRPDEANILVSFEGSPKEFSDALVLKKFENFSIRIFEMSEAKFRVELIPG